MIGYSTWLININIIYTTLTEFTLTEVRGIQDHQKEGYDQKFLHLMRFYIIKLIKLMCFYP
jgi:hypothetical protein